MIINFKFHIPNSKLQIYFMFFILIFIFCIMTDANAHKVNIYAYAEDGMVYSESYFVDGTKCKNSVLEVFDEKDKTKLFEGKTDDEGKFSFKIPKVTSLKLVLHASMGHQAEFTIDENEVRDAMGIKQTPKSPPIKAPLKLEGSHAPINAPKNENAEASISKLKSVSESEIESIVESAVDRKLQPVMRILVKMQEDSGKPGFTEIIGGIGYIIGILGIIAYLKARKVRNIN